jgi:hypothetical protein
MSTFVAPQRPAPAQRTYCAARQWTRSPIAGEDAVVSDNAGLPDDLGAVVLDTNAMGGGSLNLNTLHALLKITTKLPDLEIWIPEPVMWEWASHAQQTYTDAVNAARSAARKLTQAGIESGLRLPPESQERDVQAEVVSAIERLPSPFRILKLRDHPEVACDALRDQILLTPPARTKSGVKTGAADIASLRLAQAEADDNGITYAVVSADRDIRMALREWGVDDVPLIPNLKALRDALLAFQPLELRLITPLLQQISDMLEGISAGVTSLGKIDERSLIADALGNGNGDGLLSVDIDVERPGKLLLLRSVELDKEAGYGTAELIATGDVQVTGWRMDDRGDELVSESGTVYDALLTMAVTFSVDVAINDLRLESVMAAPSREGYDSCNEALNAVISTTTELPGLEDLVRRNDLPAVPTDRCWEADVNGKRVRMTLRLPRDEGDDWLWSLEISVSGETAAVSCRTRDTWSNGENGFHSDPPVGLVSNNAPSEFTLAQFALNAIYGHPGMPLDPTSADTG